MNRRSLISSVVALAPALAVASTNGCNGGITDSDGSPLPSSDAGNDVLPSLPEKDSGPAFGEAGILECFCGQCADIDATRFRWKPPTRAPGSCSNAELDAMIAFVETSPSATYKQLQGSIANAACRDCVFAQETTTWAPFVLNAAGTAVEVLNLGGCIAIASGKDDCGKAIQQWNDCLEEACASCFPTDDGGKCSSAVNKKECKKASDDIVLACGGTPAAQAALDACNKPEDKYTFIGSVRAQCVGLSDAGDGG